jgi:hypothetical protein
MRNCHSGTRLVFKILLPTVHKWKMGTDDIIPNEHEWYLPFTRGHYCSYFLNEIILLNLIQTEITPLNLIYTIKYHSFQGIYHYI